MREYHAAGFILCPAFDTRPRCWRRYEPPGIPLLVVVRPIGEWHDFAGADNETGTFGYVST